MDSQPIERKTSRGRLLAALERKKPDRLPATTHHLMPYFLETYMERISPLDFFEYFGLDAINWVVARRPDTSKGDYYDPIQEETASLEPRRICSGCWRIEMEDLTDHDYTTTRYNIVTPEKTLSTILRRDVRTAWVAERLIKEKTDIEIIEKYAPIPLCDVEEVNRQAEAFGERGIIRGTVPSFDIYGQPGCWQDAAALYGVEKLILETFYDPAWVKTFLSILADRKKVTIESMKGARFDLIELGGGDASSTVISPRIFAEFVAPFDSELAELAHGVGQRVVYHTCGGMMPLLEAIADMGVDAMETFTPPSLGGDSDLNEAKRRIGDRICMIGGFDQFNHLFGCPEEETRRAVSNCFEAAGEGGGFILAPSDHFFDAEPRLIRAFAEEARTCRY